ncbi:MAG: hypothetical protein ACLPY1_17785 [Terracidiphilus sp.]
MRDRSSFNPGISLAALAAGADVPASLPAHLGPSFRSLETLVWIAQKATPLALPGLIQGLLVHMFLIGVPISFSSSRLSK